MKEFRNVQSVKGMKKGLHPFNNPTCCILVGTYDVVKKNWETVSISNKISFCWLKFS